MNFSMIVAWNPFLSENALAIGHVRAYNYVMGTIPPFAKILPWWDIVLYQITKKSAVNHVLDTTENKLYTDFINTFQHELATMLSDAIFFYLQKISFVFFIVMMYVLVIV